MITEDYCSFEIAKLLKEKGFDEPCTRHWDYEDSKDIRLYGADDIPLTNSDLCANEYDGYVAPTLQMAMKWLREVHNILLFILPAQENGKLVHLVEIWTWNEEEGIYESTYAPMPRKEPEQAVEAAIKYCLENLI